MKGSIYKASANYTHRCGEGTGHGARKSHAETHRPERNIPAKEEAEIQTRTARKDDWVTRGNRTLRWNIERFGAIQTCIVDKLKRHAFVKMVSRKDALDAHKGISSDDMSF